MKDLPYDLWETVIGLEIHVQLNTKSKMFSSAHNHFGDEPNVNITEVCTGQPGSLPVINKEAIKKALQFGLAINANIPPVTSFDRKSYFYPDSPRNFQITQFEHPIIQGGIVTADVDGKTKQFAVKEAHLEDDAGMLKHFTSFAGIDYNRAGTPLLEIVSEPVIRSPKEAVAYAMSVKAIMEYLDASDTNMEEGSLRMDANISVRLKGESRLRPRVEIKNLNSFTFLEQATEYEQKRQIALYTAHPHENEARTITPGTYRWDSVKRELVLMRAKETAEDYRYFQEPDLIPVILSKEYIDDLKKSLPELPHNRYQRYVEKLGLSSYNASVLINDKPLCDYFERAREHCSNTQSLCNWITVEFMGRLKEISQTFFTLNLPPENIAALVNFIDAGTITGKIAKCVADDMIKSPQKHPKTIIMENPDYQPVSDTSTIEPIVDQVLKENPESVQDFLQGKTKAFAFLVGQVMKATKGKASPDVVNALLKKKLP